MTVLHGNENPSSRISAPTPAPNSKIISLYDTLLQQCNNFVFERCRILFLRKHFDGNAFPIDKVLEEIVFDVIVWQLLLQ